MRCTSHLSLPMIQCLPKPTQCICDRHLLTLHAVQECPLRRARRRHCASDAIVLDQRTVRCRTREQPNALDVFTVGARRHRSWRNLFQGKCSVFSTSLCSLENGCTKYVSSLKMASSSVRIRSTSSRDAITICTTGEKETLRVGAGQKTSIANVCGTESASSSSFCRCPDRSMLKARRFACFQDDR